MINAAKTLRPDISSLTPAANWLNLLCAKPATLSKWVPFPDKAYKITEYVHVQESYVDNTMNTNDVASLYIVSLYVVSLYVVSLYLYNVLYMYIVLYIVL